jgi:regulatory protein
MPTITRLEAQARHPDRVNVYLDGAFAFGLSLDVAASLRVGRELDEADLAQLRADEAYRRALDRALGQLGRRPRSRQELARYLAGKDVPPEVVERVLARLGELELVDDAAFAEWWVENRGRHRPRGAQALRQELWAKGVGRDEQAAAMAELDEDALALEVALAQAHRYADQPQEVFERRLGGLLARRGFGHSALRRAVAAAWAARGSGVF